MSYKYIPAGTQRWNMVESTSNQRFNVIDVDAMFYKRYVPAGKLRHLQGDVTP